MFVSDPANQVVHHRSERAQRSPALGLLPTAPTLALRGGGPVETKVVPDNMPRLVATFTRARPAIGRLDRPVRVVERDGREPLGARDRGRRGRALGRRGRGARLPIRLDQ